MRGFRLCRSRRLAHAAGGGSDFNSGTCGVTAQVRKCVKLQHAHVNDDASLPKPFHSYFLLIFKVVLYIQMIKVSKTTSFERGRTGRMFVINLDGHSSAILQINNWLGALKNRVHKKLKC